jgi:hypothetical protein
MNTNVKQELIERAIAFHVDLVAAIRANDLTPTSGTFWDGLDAGRVRQHADALQQALASFAIWASGDNDEAKQVVDRLWAKKVEEVTL